MAAVHLPQDPELIARTPDLSRALEADGYDGVWIGEVNGVDAASAAALAASGTERADIGVLLNTFTRAPTVLAMTAWTLGRVAEGRAHIVLGVASPLLVERWNGIPHRRLHARLRDVLRFLRVALDGDRTDGEYSTFASGGFALPGPARPAPSILVAACGPRALALAATEADGVVLNWVAPAEIDRVGPLPADRSSVSLVVPVCPTSDHAQMQEVMRPVVADYLQAPAYADQQRRLGRSEVLDPMWQAWAAGDRTAARTALPPGVLDELVVWGEPSECRARLEAIERSTGVRIIATFFPPPGLDFEGAALDG